MSATHDILPLDPNSPDVTMLEESVARLLGALARGTLAVELPTLPKPVSLNWAGKTFDGAVGWTLDGGELTLELKSPRLGPDNSLVAMFGVLNEPAEAHLEDGSILSARSAHLFRRSVSVDLSKGAVVTGLVELSGWNWALPGRCIWAGRLDHVRIENGNLRMALQGGATFERAIRLEGNYGWYLIEHRDKKSTSMVVDTRGPDLDPDVLAVDFLALEFVLGRPLALDYLVAVDAEYKTVGAVGLEFGGTSVVGSRRSPVADFRDIRANYPDPIAEDTWAPVLFSAVARKLREEGPDSALLIAVAVYVESVSAGSIHTKYLLAQVALEAFCTKIAEAESGSLVKDMKLWGAFVERHEAEIRSIAVDDESARMLLNKVRHNAPQRPSTRRVAAALGHFGLEIPSEALREVEQRNASAHRLVMAKESTADFQDLADRLATIQTLLVAVIAKYLGFQGPIIGWEWVRGCHKIPEWWTWDRLPEARRMYLAVEPDDGQTSQSEAVEVQG